MLILVASGQYLSRKEIELIKKDSQRSVWNTIKGSTNREETILSPKKNQTNIASPWKLKNVNLSSLSNETNIATNNNENKNKLLLSVITAVLERGKGALHYYQGLHDVAALFLINLQEVETSILVLEKVIRIYFRESTRPDFDQIIMKMNLVIFPMIEIFDPELHHFLLASNIDHTVVLPWILSWFSHDMNNIDATSRLFDAFLSSHPAFPM